MFGLQRITVHNSYYEQKTVEIRTSGHTNLSGTNAAGKTTMLQLVPLFYGCPPRLLNPKSGDKVPFLDFVLPLHSSIVIFDYSRHDGDCCAAVYSASSGGIAYRFVRGASKDTFFRKGVYARMKAGDPASDIFNLLAVTGIEVSNQLKSISEYAAIIQNDMSGHKKSKSSSRSLRHEAQRFCLGSPNSSTKLMGEMTHTLLKRKEMFSRLKNMIVETQFNYRAPEAPKNTSNIRLSSDLKGLREFSIHKGLLRECIKEHRDRLSVENQVSRFARGVKAGHESHRAALVELQEDKSKEEAHLSGERRLYEDNHQDLRIKLQDASHEKNRLACEIEKTDDENEFWIQQNIPSKQEDYKQIATFRERKEDSIQFLASLEESHQGLIQSRDQQVNIINNTLNKRSTKLQFRIGEIDKEQSAKDDKYNQSLNALGKKETDKQSALREQYQSSREKLVIRVTSSEENVKNEAYTEEENIELSSSEEKIVDIDHQITMLNDSRAKASETLDSKKKRCDEILRKVNHQAAAITEIQKQQSALETLCFPKDDSLLAQLRSQHPEWTQTIGKVITPSLLNRTDLAPTFDDNNSSFYGLSLALDRILSRDHCQQNDDLMSKFEEAKTQLRVETDVLVDLEAQASKMADEHQQASDALSVIERELKTLRQRRENAADHKLILKQRFTDAIAQRKEHLKKEVSALNRELSQLKSSFGASQENLAESYKGQKRSLFDDHMHQKADTAEKITHLREQKTQEQDEAVKKIADIVAAYEQQCKDEDIDEQVIRGAREAKDHTAQRLREVESFAETIRDHEIWNDRRWSHQPLNREKFHELNLTIDQLNNDIIALENGYQSKIRDIKVRLETLSSKISDESELCQEAKAVLGNAGAVPEGDFESGELSYLIHQLSGLLESRRTLRISVLDSVSKAKSALESNPDSKIFEAWNSLVKSRIHNSPYQYSDPEFLLQLPEDLSDLTEKNVPQIHDALIETIKAVGNTFLEFHKTLKQLEVEVNRVSRSLREKVNTNQKIDSLEDIQFFLTSKVHTDMDGWDDLESFAHEWKDWDYLLSRELPPETLENALIRVITLFQDGHIRTDISSLVGLKVTMIESGRHTVIDSNVSFDDASSNGLSYLALIVIFVGLSRYLCSDREITLTWPVDELATLDPSNVSRVFSMLDENNIQVFSAFPSTDYNLLQHFENRFILSRSDGARELTDDIVQEEANVAKMASTLEQNEEATIS